MNKNLHEFFLVALPGLEDLALAEVLAWHPELKCKTEYGGVTVMAPLEVGLSLNLCLKIPTRILLRIKVFRARDFPKLYKTLTMLPWQDWLDLSCKMEVFAASARSRLKIKKRIEETCLKAWRKAQKEHSIPMNPTLSAKLYVRIADDEVTVSLDTSGERLHKRGMREHVGEAPLRETIAAALLQMLSQNTSVSEVELVDPMAGTGAFLLEAATQSHLVEARDFAFQTFAAKDIPEPELKATRPAYKSFKAIEKDGRTLAALKHNFKHLKGLQTEVIAKDFFKLQPLEPSPIPRWVAVNPPYGERIKVEGDLMTYYSKLLLQIEKVLKPQRCVVLFPAQAIKGKMALPMNWKVLEKRKFLNGGLPVVAFVFANEA